MHRFFRSLRGQLAALILVALLIPISVIGYYTVSLELAQKNLAANTELELKNAARELEPLFAELKDTEQQEEIARLSAMVAGISRNYPGLRVSYFNGSLMYNFPAAYGMGNVSKRARPQAESLLVSIPQEDRLAELQSIIAKKPLGVEIINEDGVNTGSPLIEARVLVGASQQSLLILETRLGQFYLESRGPRQIIGGSLGLGLAIGIFGIVWISHRLQRRINSIQAGLDQVTRDLQVPLAAQSGELGVVVDAINRMREELLSKRRLEEQLQRAERLAGLGQLVAGVAHEVRNPLGIIKGTVQLMEKGVQAEPALAKYSEHLQVLKE
ncbi:MAG TPA: histidine kinase dimerization/phospho-acceptor domain-containing protein, partial [Verrucomicrobiae bacterium]|nr:histidine kinase dimerization/phospho-acceptor domain-containing protein [Verrucomicrobiae bacterium]